MSSTVEMLEAEALQLPSGDRARLVERLIASLDADPAIAVFRVGMGAHLRT